MWRTVYIALVLCCGCSGSDPGASDAAWLDGGAGDADTVVDWTTAWEAPWEGCDAPVVDLPPLYHPTAHLAEEHVAYIQPVEWNDGSNRKHNVILTARFHECRIRRISKIQLAYGLSATDRWIAWTDRLRPDSADTTLYAGIFVYDLQQDASRLAVADVVRVRKPVLGGDHLLASVLDYSGVEARRLMTLYSLADATSLVLFEEANQRSSSPSYVDDTVAVWHPRTELSSDPDALVIRDIQSGEATRFTADPGRYFSVAGVFEGRFAALDLDWEPNGPLEPLAWFRMLWLDPGNGTVEAEAPQSGSGLGASLTGRFLAYAYLPGPYDTPASWLGVTLLDLQTGASARLELRSAAEVSFLFSRIQASRTHLLVVGLPAPDGYNFLPSRLFDLEQLGLLDSSGAVVDGAEQVLDL